MKKLIFILAIFISGIASTQSFGDVKLNQIAPEFTLNTINGDKVKLSEIYKNNSVVLVVLRGWPGYQCPICTRQVGGLVGDEDKFSDLKSTVIMVYPGPSDELQAHAKEFSEDFKFPDNFYFVIDPDYSMINKYDLRWDAPKETAYPSTFVIDKNGKIVFSKISTTHSGRASNEEIFEALGALNSAK